MRTRSRWRRETFAGPGSGASAGRRAPSRRPRQRLNAWRWARPQFKSIRAGTTHSLVVAVTWLRCFWTLWASTEKQVVRHPQVDGRSHISRSVKVNVLVDPTDQVGRHRGGRYILQHRTPPSG